MRTGSLVVVAVTCVVMTFATAHGGTVASATKSNADSTATTAAQHNWVLSLMGEPVLSPAGKPPGYFALRILYVPSFRNPIAVRYESGGGSTVYRAVMLSGAGGYQLGAIKKQEISHPAMAEISALKRALQESGYWSLPPRDAVRGMDGSLLTIETVADGKHRVIERWSPESNAHTRKLDGLVAFFTSEFTKAGFWPLPMPSKEELERLRPRRPPTPPPPPSSWDPHASGPTPRTAGQNPLRRSPPISSGVGALEQTCPTMENRDETCHRHWRDFLQVT
jgi:hypothetical protein